MPTMDADAYTVWIAVAHQIAREMPAVVDEAEPPRPGRNHYRVRIRPAAGERLRFLLNGAIRLVAACADPPAGEVTTRFRDVPRGELFRLAGLRVAASADLEMPLTGEQTRALTDAERRDIAYHRPARVGEVLFNWFD
ncbi:MAG: hypothetical protein KJO75_12480 [Dactylosporangium sp.]|nr:hypothetical protein [Dactylosporangium sp.]